MTLSEGHGPLDWYQTLECSSVYHHTDFERNRCLRIQMLLFIVRWLLNVPATGWRISGTDLLGHFLCAATLRQVTL